MSNRRLLVNADDFGFTRDVNDGIVEAHRRGILTATTLMANGPAFEHAVALARENPALDIGAHLVLVQGDSLLTGRPLPESIPQLLIALARGQLDVYAELRAQILKIRSAGLEITHLDTHKHTHLLPAVLRPVARLAREFEIPWVRRPFDLPMEAGPAPESASRRLLTRALRGVAPRFDRILRDTGCRTTDHFAGFAFTGHFDATHLVALLERLPPGSTEFMTHPGRCGAELQQAATRLKQSREKELEALCAPEVKQALARHNIRLSDYRS